jgi:hypothetical protein|tara:strand:- start:896 stop:1096 length:201 start_codon:yes stop_codon:yes gene_type:complete
MKVFLTELTMYGKTYAGPNIIAENMDTAIKAAEQNGLELVGELDTIVVDDSGNSYHTELSFEETIH